MIHACFRIFVPSCCDNLYSTDSMNLKFTFLGTGTSQGVPVIGCKCPVCLSENQRDKRLRTSLMIQSETTTVVIDSGPDFRQQMLRSRVERLDGLIFTHAHKDHIAGMDDIRAYNYLQGGAINVYATDETISVLKREFEYVFSNSGYPGIPEVNLIQIQSKEPFFVGDIEFMPIQVMHHRMPVLGFRIGPFTYITDANFIHDYEKQKIFGSQILVLNALRREKHISHFTLAEALAMVEEFKPQQAFFTHISHQLGRHNEVSHELPEGISLAYDELVLEVISC